MRVVVLAGGLGSRLSEETEAKPKPMVEVGGRPLLWHIMKHFAHHGHREFVVALGYRGEAVKRYFLDPVNFSGDLRVSTRSGAVSGREAAEDWTVHLVDTGPLTGTGGRLRRLAPLLGETFLMTYGDGVSDVDLGALVAFHRAHGRAATVTAVRPPPRFGGLELDGDRVARFAEKAQASEGWVNGGYFVLEPRVLLEVAGDETHLEREPLERLAAAGELMSFKHRSFWRCVDTLRDKRALEEMWAAGAPWRVWE